MISAADIRQQAEALGDALQLQRYRTSVVLCNYYGASQLGGVGTAFDPNVPSTKLRALESMTADNALRAVVDTRLSQTVRVPDIRVQVMGGKWGRQRSGRKLGQWLSGSLRRQDLPRIVWQVATDASINPLGAARVWMENDGLHLARVRPDHVRYNPKEGKKPANLYLVYGVPRAELAARFPKHAEFIKNDAPAYKEDALYLTMSLVGDVDADLVEVIEHWKLGKPGSYSVVCGDQILNENREYKHPFFPVVELVDLPSFDAFGGHSLGEQLLPYQLKLRQMSRTIDTAQARMSLGRVYLPKGSEIEKQAFSRTPGEFIEFNAIGGGGPVIQAGQACAPEYYQRYDRIASDMFELAGVSKSQGTGTIAPGLAGASGKAQREYNDTAASRQKQFTDALDNWFERLCTAAFALAAEHFANGGEGAKALSIGSRVLEEIDFQELDFAEGEGVEFRCISVSGLPAHPSARLEYVTELVKGGFVDQRYGTKLLSIPDVEAWEDSTTAASESVNAFETASFRKL